MEREALTIEGMSCKSCAAKITSALEAVPGVVSADVSHTKGKAIVELERPVADDILKEAASVNGQYKVIDIITDISDEAGQSSHSHHKAEVETEKKESLYPLFLIVGYILGVILLIAAGDGNWDTERLMRHFMAGFFLVFSFFKLLDLEGFVDAYTSYDLLAQKSEIWGWIYPFVELALGVLYLLALAPLTVNAITLILMLVGAAGVLKALMSKTKIRCACLGTALNLPMTKITLVEDLGMAVMAALMLLVHA